jgi:hypothetical protein
MYNLVQVLNRSDDLGDHCTLLAISIEDYRDKLHFKGSPQRLDIFFDSRVIS